MTLTTEPELVESPMRLFSFTVDQYHEMIELGILPEGAPFELLDGHIVRKDRSAAGEDPMTVGDDHTYSVMKLNLLNLQLIRLGCHLRPQQPIVIPPSHEPEPDGAIVSGTVEDYVGRKPAAAAVLCAIEVSDSSLHHDRTRKLRIYANGDIPLYVIVNLIDGVVELYSEPMVGKGRYARAETLTRGKTVAFPTGKRALTVAVKDLLPPVNRQKYRNGRKR
jgi:Uma2 family endonuclease